MDVADMGNEKYSHEIKHASPRKHATGGELVWPRYFLRRRLTPC
jgi:hypothetical protein